MGKLESGIYPVKPCKFKSLVSPPTITSSFEVLTTIFLRMVAPFTPPTILGYFLGIQFSYGIKL